MPASNANPDRPRRRRGWLYVLMLLIAAGAAYWYYSQDTSPRAPGGPAGSMSAMRGMFGANVPVRVTTAELRTLDHTLHAIGTVEAFNTVTVRSRVDGELLEILFADGQKVEQGDVLARIDP